MIKKLSDVEALNSVYRELVELIGFENTEKLFYHYKGQQISFPSRIYDKQYIKAYLKEQYDGKNTKELARRINYSKQWVRKKIKTLK